MLKDIENLNTGTDTATEKNVRNDMQFSDSEARGLKVRSSVKAGGYGFGAGGPLLNHSEPKGLKVRSSVKVGGPILQHSEAKGLRMRTR